MNICPQQSLLKENVSEHVTYLHKNLHWPPLLMSENLGMVSKVPSEFCVINTSCSVPYHCLFLSYPVVAYNTATLHYSVPCHPWHLHVSGPLFI